MKPHHILTSIFVLFSALGAFHSLWWLVASAIIFILFLIDIIGDKDRTFFFGWAIYPLKEVKTEWGSFYIQLYEDKDRDSSTRVRLFHKMKLGYCKLSDFSYHNLEHLKKQIEYDVDSHCGYQQRLKMKKDKIKKEVKDWNGAINKIIDRDTKIDEII